MKSLDRIIRIYVVRNINWWACQMLLFCLTFVCLKIDTGYVTSYINKLKQEVDYI